MLTYILPSGEIYDIPPEKEQEFLQKFPTAKLQDSNLGKTSPTIPGAVVEETAAPINTDFKSVPYLSAPEYQIPEKQEDRFNKFTTLLNNIGLVVPKLAEKAGDIQKLIQINMMSMAGKMGIGELDKLSNEQLDFIADNVSVNMGGIIGKPIFGDQLEEYISKQEDKNYKSKYTSIKEAQEAGDLGEAAYLAANGLIESSPSIIAAFMGPAAIGVYAGMIAGDKFEEELKNSPNETIGMLTANALATGAIQGFGDLALRGLGKFAGVIAGKPAGAVAAQQASKFIQGGLQQLGKKFIALPVGEGLTEVAQELAQEYVDLATLKRKEDVVFDQELKYRLWDSFILGGLMGQTVNLAGSLAGADNIQKSYAEGILMPESVKSKLKENAEQYNKLTKDLSSTEDQNARDKIKKQMGEIEGASVKINSTIVNGIYSMNPSELNVYAKNKDQISKNIITIQKQNIPASAKQIAKEEIKELEDANINILKTALNRKTEETIETGRKEAEKLGIKFKEFETTEDVEKYLKSIDRTEIEIKESKDDAGFILRNPDGTREIIINKDSAKKTLSVNVASHELFHGILFKTLKENTGAAINLKNELLKELNKINITEANPALKRRLELYKNKPEEIQAEELMAIYADAIANKEIVYNENIFTRLGDFVRRILQDSGFIKIKFDTGRDVYNFIKDYNKDIAKGGLRKSILKGAIEGFKGELIQANKDVEISQEPKSSKEASDRVQKIFEEKGLNGFNEIVNEFEPIVNNLVNKYRNTPGFNFQDLKDEIIYNPDVGMYSLVRTYNKEKGVPLAAWINKYLKVRTITAANTILKKEFDIDITETQVAREEVAPEPQVFEPSEIKNIKPLVDLNVDEDLALEYTNAIQKELLKLSDEEILDLNYANLKDLAPSITKKIFGTSRDEKIAFILNNAKIMHDIFPMSYMLSARGDKKLMTSTKIKGKILENFYIKGERLSMKEGGTAAGLEVQNKKPYSKSDFEKLIGLEPGKEYTRNDLRNQDTAINSLQAEIGRAITNSLVRNELIQKGIDPNVVALLADGKSEILASKAQVISIDNIQKSFQEAINEELPNLDNFPNKVTSYNEFEKGLFNKFINKYPTYIDGNNQAKNLSETLFTPYFTEYYARKIILINNPNWKSKFKDLKGPDSTGDADLTFINEKGEELLVEVKLSKKDQMGGGSLSYSNNILVPVKTMDNFDLIKNQINTIDLDNYLKAVKSNKFPLSKVSKELRENAKNLQKKIAKTIKLSNVNEIRNKYKNADLIVFIKENEVYNIGNKEIENIPPFDGSQDIEIRVGYSKTDANGFANAGLRVINRLKTSKKSAAKLTDLIFSSKEDLSTEFNKILEESKGIAADKIIGKAEGQILGSNKGRYKLLPYSAEDLEGLFRYFAGKGEQGNKHLEWFKNNIFRPLSEGLMAYDSARQNVYEITKSIKKEIKNSGIDLGKKIKSQKYSNIEKYTNEQAIRIFMWAKKGYEIPGELPSQDISDILKYVRQDLGFMKFYNQLNNAFPDNMYAEPDENWLAGTITTDILDSLNTKTRAEYLTPFFENLEQVLGELKGNKLVGNNINKIRAIYGDNMVNSLENIVYRIKTGRNRSFGQDKLAGQWMNWVNDAVGTIMFFNTRSALLQTISFANYINWSDNNVVAAAQTYGTKEYYETVAEIFNSDFLKQRRAGLKTDVNADEIANAAAKSDNKIKAFISVVLKKGFLPTQIADSVAISIGGASFYINRTKKYIKDGLSQKEAKEKAFVDFKEITESAQQSSRPDRISVQQASGLGRVILAFQNTPMQYTRLMKKAAMDLVNNRGDWKSNAGKILYYGAIQNLIFHTLQSAAFAMIFSDEDEEEEKKKYFNVANRMADTLLTGTGVYGAIAATTKNIILEVIDQEKKGRRDFEKAALKLTALSPPINSKLNKFLSAGRRLSYKQEREKMRELGLDTRNPAVISASEILSVAFNLPADRAIRKWNNLRLATDKETELWQSIMLALGYSEWDINLSPAQKEPKAKTTGLKEPKVKLRTIN